MANNNNVKRLIKESTIMNILNTHGDEGFITLLIEGSHGQGKSAAVRSAASEMGGICVTIEGGVLQQGELTGIPLALKDAHTGEPIFKFIKHPQIEAIANIEKRIYEKFMAGELLGGKLRYDAETNEIIYEEKPGTVHRYPQMSEWEKIARGEVNEFKFGEELPAKVKLQLLENKDIPTVQLFIDELNRAEMPTMKEMMNLVLNRNINGYYIPWWVNIVSAINPASDQIDYAVSDLDPAQLDRFMKVRLTTDFKEWVDFALSTKRDANAVAALAADPQLFGNNVRYDSTENRPSPRSWSIAIAVVETLQAALSTKFFSDEERKMYDDDLHTLICAKVGLSQGEEFIANINNKETRIIPTEMLTCKAPKCPESAVAKFKAQNTITRLCTISLILNYINDNFDAIMKTDDEERKVRSFNFTSQLKHFVTEVLSGAEQMFVISKIKNPMFIRDDIFKALAVHIFGKELYARIVANDKELKEIGGTL